MAKFDPYRQWLGIPPEEQPPNYYRLLGVGLFESDPDVISHAADRQMVHLRTFQSGGHGELSQQLLNETSAARVCLLDPHKKGEYDARLRRELAADSPTPPPPPAAIPPPPPPPVGNSGPLAAAGPPVPPLQTGTGTVSGATRSSGFTTRRNKPAWQAPAITLLLVGVSLVLLFWALNSSQSDQPRTIGPATGQDDNGNRASPNRRPKRVRNRPNRQQRLPKRPPDSPGSGPDSGSGLAGAEAGIRVFKGHTNRVTRAVFSPDGALILSGSDDKSVRLWDVATGAERLLEGPDKPILTVAFSPDGQIVLAVSGYTDPPSEGMLHLWEAASGQPTHRVDISKADVVWDLAFSPDGRLILLACEDKSIRVLDATDRKDVKESKVLMGHQGPVRGVAFSPEGSKILSGSADQELCLWELTSGEPIRSMAGHQGAVTSVAFSPDGRCALSGGIDKTVRLWDVATGEPRQTFEGHLNEVTGVSFTPGGQYALSSSLDRTIRLWRLSDGTEVRQVGTHDGGVRSISVSADGRHAVSAGDDAVVRLWELPESAWALVSGPSAANGPPAPTPGGQAAPPKRIAVPAAGSLAQAETLVKNDFQADFEAAAGPSGNLALARKLLGEGRKPQDDPARTYTLLRLAGDRATEAGDAETALAALDAMGKRFEMDWLAAKLATLQSVSEKVTVPAGNKLLVGKILAVANEAVAAGDFDVAGRVIGLAGPPAANCREGILAKGRLSELVQSRAGKIEELKEAGVGADDPKALEDPAHSPIFGDNPASEAAVDRALGWLARHQNQDGSWGFDHRRDPCKDECPHPGTLTKAPNAATALALLPFLAAGHGPQKGKLQGNVHRGLEFLKSRMQVVQGAASLHEPVLGRMPSHALGTIALCGACGAASDRQTRIAAQAAVNLIIKTQNRDGGWGSTPSLSKQASGLSSVDATGWNLAALKTAQWAGLNLPNKKALQLARQYLQNMRTKDNTGYRRNETVAQRDATATAVAMLSQMCLGRPRDDRELIDYVAALGKSGPSSTGQLYLNYYNGQVMRHCGGPTWKQWNPALRDHLIANQAGQGHAAGSWFFRSSEWGSREGGRLFCTAIAALILEVYYRHPPLYP